MIRPLERMLTKISQEGDECKIDVFSFLEWLLNDYEDIFGAKRVKEAYYRFHDEALFSSRLLKLNLPLEKSNQRIQEMIRKRKKALKPKSRRSKKQTKEVKLQTSPSEQRKVGFE